MAEVDLTIQLIFLERSKESERRREMYNRYQATNEKKYDLMTLNHAPL